MHSVLLIAQGPEASIPAEMLLRREAVVITRSESCGEAAMLLEQAPFDVVVCAIDELAPESRSCLDLLAEMTGVPKVVVLSDSSLPIRSFELDTRVVPIELGLSEVRTVLRQQIRRATNTPQSNTTRDGNFEFSFKFPARPDRIGKARTVAGSFIQRCLGMSDGDLTRLELVLEEAICNAIYHGSLEVDSSSKNDAKRPFKTVVAERMQTVPYCEREVEVRLEIDQEELRITVADEGPGFVPKSTTTVESTEPFGRGLLLMHAFADSVEFNECGNAITLTIKKNSVRRTQSTSPSTLQFASDQ